MKPEDEAKMFITAGCDPDDLFAKNVSPEIGTHNYDFLNIPFYAPERDI